MFEGNRNCVICHKEIIPAKAKYWLSLSGVSYVFCNECYQNKKEKFMELIGK